MGHIFVFVSLIFYRLLWLHVQLYCPNDEPTGGHTSHTASGLHAPKTAAKPQASFRTTTNPDDGMKQIRKVIFSLRTQD